MTPKNKQMRAEEEVRERLKFLSDNLIDFVSSESKSNNLTLSKLKYVILTLKWVLGERETILVKSNRGYEL